MFGKKCPKCGSKLKKENVWHADKSEFSDEWTCKKCGDLPSPNKSPNKKPEPEIIQKTESKPVLLNLQVEEAYPTDFHHGIARLSRASMMLLEVSLDDIIEIEGKSVTVVKVLPLDASESGITIRLDGLVRKNANVSIGDTVVVRKSKIKIIEGKGPLESLRIRQYFLTNGSPPDLATTQSKGEYVSEAITKLEKVCSYEDCNAKLTGLDSFNCKYCKQKFCVEHKQAENHNCIKTRYTKYIRKTWLRKRGQNITSGQYIVICDTCGYVSNIGSLIEYAGEELEYHVKTQGCTEKAIFLEEDLSHEEAPRDVKSHLVLEDRPFWVCAYCRPPRKFNTRDEYIAHHYFHN